MVSWRGLMRLVAEARGAGCGCRFGLCSNSGRARRSGLALAEVAAGSLLLAISLGAVIGLSGAAMTSQLQGRQLMEAAMLADEQLSLVLARGPDDYGSRFGLRGACDPPFGGYRYELEFSSPSSSARGRGTGGVGGSGSMGGAMMDPYVVTVTVFWEGRGGAERSVSVQTLMASRDGGDDPDPDRRPESTVERAR